MISEEKKTPAASETGGGEELDPRRLAHMLAWRERYIHKMEEVLAGYEEERELTLALFGLFLGVLVGKRPAFTHEKEGDADVLHIPRRVLATVMSGTRAAFEVDEAECRIYLREYEAVPGDTGEEET